MDVGERIVYDLLRDLSMDSAEYIWSNLVSQSNYSISDQYLIKSILGAIRIFHMEMLTDERYELIMSQQCKGAISCYESFEKLKNDRRIHKNSSN